MPGISSEHSAFEVLAQNCEKLNPSSVAICTTSWHLPVFGQSIMFNISSTRRATAIEEYIMKAAELDISYSIDKDMLPEILGLDEIFIETALSHLLEKNILDKNLFPVLKLTETGKSLHDKNLVFDREQTKKISYYIDLKTAFVYAKPTESAMFPMHPQYKLIEKGTENVKKYINRKFLKDTCSTLGVEIDNPEKNTAVSSILSAKTGDAVKTLFTEILMYNIKENRAYIKVWDHAGKCFRDDIAKMLNILNAKSGYSYEIYSYNASDSISVIKNDIEYVFRGEEKNKLTENAVSSAENTIIIRTPLLSTIVENTLEALYNKFKDGIKVVIYYQKSNDNNADSFAADFKNKFKTDLCFELIESESCNIYELMTDYATLIISGWEWVKCSGEYIKCCEPCYLIKNKELIEKRFAK